MGDAAIHIELPDWCSAFIERRGECLGDVESRMRFVLEIARINIHNGGGPFAAAVFDRDQRLLSIGMNLVTLGNCSVLHAEVVAIILAEQQRQHYDLEPGHELVTSCEPCTMCLGALMWSGINHLICGARDEDARAIGFDEGPKPGDMAAELAQRGIQMKRDILRREAVAVLQDYLRSGQEIYNPGRD